MREIDISKDSDQEEGAQEASKEQATQEPIPGALPRPTLGTGLDPTSAWQTDDIWDASQDSVARAKKDKEKADKREAKAKAKAKEKAEAEALEKSKTQKTSKKGTKASSQSAKSKKPTTRDDQPVGGGDSKKGTSKKSPTVPRGKDVVKGSQAKQKGNQKLYITYGSLSFFFF